MENSRELAGIMGGYVVLRVFGIQRRGPLEWQPCRRGCQEQVSKLYKERPQ